MEVFKKPPDSTEKTDGEKAKDARREQKFHEKTLTIETKEGKKYLRFFKVIMMKRKKTDQTYPYHLTTIKDRITHDINEFIEQKREKQHGKFIWGTRKFFCNVSYPKEEKLEEFEMLTENTEDSAYYFITAHILDIRGIENNFFSGETIRGNEGLENLTKLFKKILQTLLEG